jgi:type IV pilus secretin PilQ/predicted competence protein
MGNVVTPECGAERRRPTRVLWGAGLAIALALGCASGKPVRVAEAPATGTAEAAAETGAAPAGETAPITIRTLDLAEGAPETFLNLEASGPVVWTSYRDPEGRVVLELPNAVPAAGLADLSPVEGLVQGVAIERGQEGNRPLTRLVVATRQQVEHGVTADGPRLQLRLMPLEEETVAAVPPPAEPPAPAAPAITYEPVPESETAAAEPEAESAAPETAAEPTADEVAAEMAAEPGLPGTAESPAVAPAPRGAAATRLESIETLSAGDGDTVVRLAGDGEFPYSTFLLNEPTRFVIDLPGVINRSPRSTVSLPSGPVHRVRVAQFKPVPQPVARVVFDLATHLLPRIERTRESLVVRFGTPAAIPQARPAAAAPPPAVAAERPLERPAPFQTAAAQAPQVEIEEEDTPAEAIPPAPPPPRGPSQVEVTRRPEAIEPPVASEPGLVTARPPAETFAAQAVGETERVYSGEPIDLKVTNAEVNDVLRTFAQLSGLNIIVQPGVTGTVTAEMENVPWDQALEQILRINGLGYEVEGNVMRIAPVAVLRQEARDRQDLAQARALAIPLRTVIKRLSYADANAVAILLRSGAGGGLLSQRGNVIVDLRTNTLIIKELPAFLETVLKVIENLDIPEPQVMIEARIVETTKSFTRSLGIDWGFDAVSSAATGNTTGLVFPNNAAVGGDVNLGAGGTNGLLNVRLGNVLNTFTLDVALDAAENEGLINILSAPKVATLNNQPASIQSGLQIPIQTIANNTVTVQFVNATLSLDVTPHVTAEGTILMDIDIRKREPQLGLVVPGATNAPISTKEASTRVIVRDGGTTVIGGIYKLSSDEGEDRIPGLANIPILGYLFRNRTQRDENEELLIFITPRVMKL